MNTTLPDILHTPLVPRATDDLWTLPDALQVSGTGKDVLVISQPYRQGSGDEIQLQKMLQACKLGPERYDIFFLDEGKLLSWHKLRDAMQPKYILLLGVLPEQLGISAMFRLYTPNGFNDCTWIPSISLAELENQAEAKKMLWQNALKPIFADQAQTQG